MSGGKQEKIKTVIEYVYPDDFNEIFATGVRLMISAPSHVKFNFFWDKMQDEIAEETMTVRDNKMNFQVSKKASEGGYIRREFVASVTIPMPAFQSLVQIMNKLIKEVMTHEPEEKKEKIA